MPTSVRRVFISYRREDTGAAAGRVYDRLWHLLSKSNVFFDVTSIGAGEDFEKKIDFEMSRSDVALIFIGDKWTGSREQTAKSNIWDHHDYVRAEVRAALNRTMLVLPILVFGARMPRPEDLPEDIRGMARLNALPLRHESFDHDVENIIVAIVGPAPKPRGWLPWLRMIAYATVGVLGAGAAVLALAQLHFWILARPLAASIGEAGTLVLLAAALILGIWLGLKYGVQNRRPY
jgi:hypothetical protein